MKIKPEHFEECRKMLEHNGLDTTENRARYKAAGLSDMRYRWDIFRLSGGIEFLCKELYKYMNDEHMDTALRKLVRPL